MQNFNVGNQSLLDALDEYYLSSYLQDGGAAYKMVIGDYGNSKSHFLYCLRDLAWHRGFAVVKVYLSPVETPYNDQRLFYSAVFATWQPNTATLNLILGATSPKIKPITNRIFT